MWEARFREAIRPVCGNTTTTSKWTGHVKTALASNPRSGNTWVRELVERTTGFQTSTAGYCDVALAKTFLGECDPDAKFLVKTHHPAMLHHNQVSTSQYARNNGFTKAVHIVRNPIDSIFSEWQLEHYPKAMGQLDHTGRLNVGEFGSDTVAGHRHRKEAIAYAKKWAMHEEYWTTSSFPTHHARYEDLIDYKLPTLMSILAFLLPPDELPSLSQVACVTELDAAREAYKSRKNPAFSTWNTWNPELRKQVIEIVRPGWCRQGYNVLLRKVVGEVKGIDGICDF
ncbi:hypothetical protein T439DRAFT_137768 [Meredithblackwellia eburnea MCA 4105]